VLLGGGSDRTRSVVQGGTRQRAGSLFEDAQICTFPNNHCIARLRLCIEVAQTANRNGNLRHSARRQETMNGFAQAEPSTVFKEVGCGEGRRDCCAAYRSSRLRLPKIGELPRRLGKARESPAPLPPIDAHGKSSVRCGRVLMRRLCACVHDACEEAWLGSRQTPENA
jgi:hypothetical protein